MSYKERKMYPSTSREVDCAYSALNATEAFVTDLNLELSDARAEITNLKKELDLLKKEFKDKQSVTAKTMELKEKEIGRKLVVYVVRGLYPTTPSKMEGVLKKNNALYQRMLFSSISEIFHWAADCVHLRDAKQNISSMWAYDIATPESKIWNDGETALKEGHGYYICYAE